MADETDKTVDALGSLDDTTPTPPHRPGEDRSLEDILEATSTDIIHAFAASINQNAAKEASKTEDVRQELKRRLFRVIIRTYVWSTARFAHETERAEGQLVKDVQDLLTAERDQDRVRARLGELMAAVSKALAMFG